MSRKRWIPQRTALYIGLLATTPLYAQTGTFLDKNDSTDVRIMSYNILWDSIFPDGDPCNHPWRSCNYEAAFRRIIVALNPDIACLQEITWFSGCHTADDVAAIFDEVLPLGGGQTWYAYLGRDCCTVSRWPLSMTSSYPYPRGDTPQSMALVDLPDDVYDRDIYIMNEHFKCCGGSENEAKRQLQADALANWMRDARQPGGAITLPYGTPMAVVGDLNIVGGNGPLNALIHGNISDEGTFGPDAPPDWDTSSNTDAAPKHNIVGPYTATYGLSGYNRLDYIIYTDSVLQATKKFVLNSTTMSSGDLAAAGLQSDDVITCPPYQADHLPVVVDFQLGSPDCNANGVPDSEDVSLGTSDDCDENGQPDECQIDASSSAPGGPFYCQGGCGADCNENGVPDSCDLDSGFSQDCNNNLHPDFCDVTSGASDDCNANVIPDECDVDSDYDGFVDGCDNCLNDPNPTQLDTDLDAQGDVCDPDDENDGVDDADDNCPIDTNPDQNDADGDGAGDACDICPGTASGQVVDDVGCPWTVPGDFDGDQDVDLLDFSHIQRCLQGPFESMISGCDNADINGDDKVGAEDVDILVTCLSGSNVFAEYGCDQP